MKYTKTLIEFIITFLISFVSITGLALLFMPQISFMDILKGIEVYVFSLLMTALAMIRSRIDL